MNERAADRGGEREMNDRPRQWVRMSERDKKPREREGERERGNE